MVGVPILGTADRLGPLAILPNFPPAVREVYVRGVASLSRGVAPVPQITITSLVPVYPRVEGALRLERHRLSVAVSVDRMRSANTTPVMCNMGSAAVPILVSVQ